MVSVEPHALKELAVKGIMNEARITGQQLNYLRLTNLIRNLPLCSVGELRMIRLNLVRAYRAGVCSYSMFKLFMRSINEQQRG
jgi:hypothetical protein